MTGEIRRDGDFARTSNPQSDIYIMAGEGYERISGLLLRGVQAEYYPGHAQLIAGDTNVAASLDLSPDGKLTLNNNQLVTMPNWSAAVSNSMNTQYTASVDGYVFVFVNDNNQTNSGVISYFSINGVQYPINHQAGAANSVSCGSCCLFPVSKGDVYICYPGRTGHDEEMKFIPCKGAV